MNCRHYFGVSDQGRGIASGEAYANGESPGPGVPAPADQFIPLRGASLDFQQFPRQVNLDLADLAFLVLPPDLDRVLPLILGLPG